MAGAHIPAIDRVHAVLDDGVSMSAQAIADDLEMPYAMVNRALRQLEGDGFVRTVGKVEGTNRALWAQDPAAAQGDRAAHASRAHVVPARQLGMQRDSLVAALFGPAGAVA